MRRSAILYHCSLKCTLNCIKSCQFLLIVVYSAHSLTLFSFCSYHNYFCSLAALVPSLFCLYMHAEAPSHLLIVSVQLVFSFHAWVCCSSCFRQCEYLACLVHLTHTSSRYCLVSWILGEVPAAAKKSLPQSKVSHHVLSLFVVVMPMCVNFRSCCVVSTNMPLCPFQTRVPNYLFCIPSSSQTKFSFLAAFMITH